MAPALESDADAADDGAEVRFVGRAPVAPYRPKNALPVACWVLSESRVTKVQPLSLAALARQQVKTPLRWSDDESAIAAEVTNRHVVLLSLVSLSCRRARSRRAVAWAAQSKMIPTRASPNTVIPAGFSGSLITTVRAPSGEQADSKSSARSELARKERCSFIVASPRAPW
jgi:hypothetical protein